LVIIAIIIFLQWVAS